MDQTDTNETWATPSETWATPSAPPQPGVTPRVRFTPPPPAKEPEYAGLDAFPYVVPYLLGGIVASRSPLKQRFGDRVAETIVVSHADAVKQAVAAPYERPVRQPVPQPAPQAAPQMAPQMAPQAKPPAPVVGPSPSTEVIEPPARRFRLRVVLIPVLVLALIACG